ncbi:GNAT family N-acetyltransferase [Actinopolymorpha singaporensis]|uniref:Acetyltransferase (GNAT) domain-containing protein n=1 Tax=Actinopolymorpha singaporensis TaxID=117157 RepID=A0A1H1M4N4_9ACTN|nr:GNAT family N-acetyltransferase [Actinopolymorpha singaporensis]SDR81640.1 Acetyltransferase (GNAT) domain-containing protein [Actinopolymorpha singaporensis]
MTGHEEGRDGAVVRPATVADRNGITWLLRHLHAEGADGTTLPRVRQEAQTFVATNGEQVAGLVVATFVDYGIEAYGTVEELLVEPASRGRGVGRSLLDRSLSWLAAAGAEVVFVSALDEDVVGFYASAGFKPCSGPWLYWTRPVRR